jgi:glycosyltransferase involved in cell wall biosynthesis
MQEAMCVGTPIIIAFAGGSPSLAKHEESALFFPMGDVESCADQMLRLLESETLSKSLSAHALVVAQARNAPDKILQQQLSNYSQVIEVNSYS